MQCTNVLFRAVIDRLSYDRQTVVALDDRTRPICVHACIAHPYIRSLGFDIVVVLPVLRRVESVKRVCACIAFAYAAIMHESTD